MQRVCWELQTCQGHMQMREKSGFVMHSYNRQTNLSAPTHHSCGHLFVFCWEQLHPADKRYQDFHLWSSRWLILSVYGFESSASCFNWVVFWSGWVTGVKIMYVQKSLATHSFVMLKPIYLQCLNKYINNSAGNTESIDRRKCGQSFLVWKGEALIQPPIKGQECF